MFIKLLTDEQIKTIVTSCFSYDFIRIEDRNDDRIRLLARAYMHMPNKTIAVEGVVTIKDYEVLLKGSRDRLLESGYFRYMKKAFGKTYRRRLAKYHKSDEQLYLEQVFNIQQQIKSKQLLIEQLHAQAESVTSSIKAVTVQSSSMGGGFVNPVIKIDELKRAIGDDVTALKDAMQDIVSRLNTMYLTESKLANILHLRYVSCLNWEEICSRLIYKWSRMHELHAEALQEFKKYMPNKKSG